MPRKKKAQLHVGTSGYQYDHWRGRFYPEKMPKKAWFSHYAQHFDTVEINNTFYNLPQPSTFDDWREHAPPGFCYVLKYSRYGSHLKHLKDPADHLDMFLAAAERLKSHLGPILVQLPPSWNADLDRLGAFLKAAPQRRRWVIEFRNKSWLRPDVYDLLRRYKAAMCIHDLIPDHPRELTADWTYLRFHGPQDGESYARCYPHQALSAAARRIRAWLADGIDVYAFFNNDRNAYAVDNALALRRYVE